MDKFIGDVYIMQVSDVVFDNIVSTFNRVQDDSEYLKTRESIKNIGQIDPIYIDSGKCIDGRHRVKALKDLGIHEVKAVNIDSSLSIEDKLTLCNKDLTSGRDLTKTQLAIQAFKYCELTGCTKAGAAKKFGVDKRMLTYAGEVRQYLPLTYNALMEYGKAEIDGKYTQSLERVYKFINSEVKPNKVKDVAIGIDYNELITTDKGKELFWLLYNSRSPDPELANHLVEYVNLRFIDTKE